MQCMGIIVSFIQKSGAVSIETSVKDSDEEVGPTDEEIEPEHGPLQAERMAKVRDSMLDLLTERVRDISFFTRAAVLKVRSFKVLIFLMRHLLKRDSVGLVFACRGELYS